MISGLTTKTKLALLGATRGEFLSSSSKAETEASVARLAHGPLSAFSDFNNLKHLLRLQKTRQHR